MVSPSEIGGNVVRIRAAAGLRQTALAKKAGISRLALGKIERGESLPQARTLSRLAVALRVPVRELVTPVKRLQSVRFRARKNVNEREQILAEVSNWLQDYCWLEEQLESKRKFSLAKLSREKHPKRLAAKVRANLGIDDAPVRDICGLFEESGIKVRLLQKATDVFFGLSVGPCDGGPVVVVNTWNRISVERRIFTAAHELGHLLLHQDSYQRDATEEPKEQEREADLFASYFLVPESTFRKEWEETAGHSLLERVLKVKRIFRVSYMTILMRLIQEGKVSKDVFKEFQIQHKRRFGTTLRKRDEPNALAQMSCVVRRSEEPDRLSESDFMGDRFNRFVREALDREELSLSRAAEMLRLSTHEMRQLVKEWV